MTSNSEKDHEASGAPFLKEPFDPHKALAELVANTPDRAERKLSLWEQCGAFAALYKKTSHKVVAETFGVSMATVSKLGGCLQRDPRPFQTEMIPEKTSIPIMGTNPRDGKPYVAGRRPVLTGREIEKTTNRDMNKNRLPGRIWRYRRVAEIFEQLGEAEFFRLYYTEEIHLRLMRVKYGVGDEASSRKRGADPAAEPFRSFTVPAEGSLPPARIDCIWLERGESEMDGAPMPAGWSWSETVEGQTTHSPETFKTPKLAEKNIRDRYDFH